RPLVHGGAAGAPAAPPLADTTERNRRVALVPYRAFVFGAATIRTQNTGRAARSSIKSLLTNSEIPLNAQDVVEQINSDATTSLLVCAHDRVMSDNNGSPARAQTVTRASRSHLMKTLMKFVKDESGATAIEYGLIAAGIAVAIIVVVRGVGTNLNKTFQAVKDNLQ